MSKIVELAVNSKPYQNVDDITLSTFSDSLYDGYIDELGNTNKRDGLSSFANPETFKRIDGAYWWEKKQIAIIVTDGKTYKITNNTGTIISITGDLLETSGRVSFADNGGTLVMANGGRMVTTDGTVNTAYIASANAPILVSHVAFLDQWLLANNDGTGQFYYADFTAAPTTWLVTSVFTAEANPDDLLGVFVNKRIIYLPGTESFEFWVNDGVTPFTRSQGTTTARGMIGKNAIVFANEVAYYLDDKRRLIKLDGTIPQIISTPFDRTIQNFTTVTDILMDYVTVDGKHFILLSFPTEDRTLVYDIVSESWNEWSFWDAAGNDRKRFLGNAYAYARAWNKHLFGRMNNSQVYEMNNTTYADDGVDIHFTKITGHIDHGVPSKKKRSYKLTLRIKTGVGLGDGNTIPYLLVRWKDNGENIWSNYRRVSLKAQGNTGFVATLKSLGSYYTRQWEFKMTEQVPFVLGQAFEEIDINAF